MWLWQEPWEDTARRDFAVETGQQKDRIALPLLRRFPMSPGTLTRGSQPYSSSLLPFSSSFAQQTPCSFLLLACRPSPPSRSISPCLSRHSASYLALLPGRARSPSWQVPQPSLPEQAEESRAGRGCRIPPARDSPYVVIILLVSRKSRMPFGEDTSNCSRWDLRERQGTNWSSKIPESKPKANVPASPTCWGTLIPGQLSRVQQSPW